MNKYEQRADKQRRSAMKASTSIWTAGIALVVVVLLILGLSRSAPPSYFTKAAVLAAVLLLVVRQVTRRLKGKRSRAAEPDPKSALHLD